MGFQIEGKAKQAPTFNNGQDTCNRHGPIGIVGSEPKIFLEFYKSGVRSTCPAAVVYFKQTASQKCPLFQTSLQECLRTKAERFYVAVQ